VNLDGGDFVNLSSIMKEIAPDTAPSEIDIPFLQKYEESIDEIEKPDELEDRAAYCRFWIEDGPAQYCLKKDMRCKCEGESRECEVE